MSINVESTTDTKEEVIAAAADKQTTEVKAEEVVDKEVKNAEPAEESASSEETNEIETEDSETPDEEEEREEQEERPRKKNGFKKRIDKLNSRLSERERELEYWRQEAIKSKAIEEKPAPKEVEEGEPIEGDFDDPVDYWRALSKYEAKKMANEAIKKFQEESREKQVLTEQQRVEVEHHKRVTEFSSKVDDFDDVLESVADVPISLVLRDIFINSENGPELMYELAKDREELDRINQLPALLAAREIGKFETSLGKVSKEVKTTKAPPPVKPVSKKTSGVAKTIYDKDISQREYERLREAQLKY